MLLAGFIDIEHIMPPQSLDKWTIDVGWSGFNSKCT